MCIRDSGHCDCGCLPSGGVHNKDKAWTGHKDRGHEHAGGNRGRYQCCLLYTSMENKEKAVKDLVDMRIIIEPEIAALAAQYAKEDDIRELEQRCLEVEYYIRSGKSHVKSDVAFHSQIAAVSYTHLLSAGISRISSGSCIKNRTASSFPPMAILRTASSACAGNSPRWAYASALKLSLIHI